MVNLIIGIFISLLGAIFASFFGVIISRVPQGLSIVSPNSHCEKCGHELKWYENIPILSYLCLGGKCKECKTKIGISSFIYEVVGLVIALLTYLRFGNTIEMVIVLFISLLFLLMAGYDYKTKTILDIMWILLLVAEAALFIYRILVLKQDYLPYVISASIAAILFILIKLIGYLVLKKDILGTGDIIVFILACLSYNYFGLVLSLLCSCLPGSIIELIKMKKTTKNTEIAFLPYLLVGCYISMLYSSSIYQFIMEII